MNETFFLRACFKKIVEGNHEIIMYPNAIFAELKKIQFFLFTLNIFTMVFFKYTKKLNYS